MNRFAALIALVPVALLVLPEAAHAAVALVTVRVPEPATAALLATGIAGVALEARRRRNAKRDDD